MNHVNTELDKFLKLSDLNLNDHKSKANLLALMAATMHYFIDLIMDEVDRAGFQNTEFLEKTIFFLRAVTPKYPLDQYSLILDTLKKVDERFVHTEFYYGLEALRKITSGIDESNLSVIQGEFKADIEIKPYQNAELSFFTTYLIENTINYITKIRMNKNVVSYDNSYLKKAIDEKFDNCVIQTVVNIEELKHA